MAYIGGTSTVILGVADRLVLDPDHRFLVTPLAVPGCWGLEMDLLATGSAITWLADLLGGGMDATGLVELAAATDPGRAPVLLPYLTPGEQGALWDPLLHGAIVGLDLGHGREHLARALVNGIILESRRCLAVLDETCGPGHAVEVAGGSAAAPSFRADLADAVAAAGLDAPRRRHRPLGPGRGTDRGAGRRRRLAGRRVPGRRPGRRARRGPRQALGRSLGRP